MAIPTLGKITLTVVSGGGSSITLTTDPDTYVLEWPPRRSYFPHIGGGVKQDFGKFAVDCVVKMQSGASQWLNKSVVIAMDTNDAIKGATWRLQDFEGNDFTVSIDKWSPVVAKGMALVGLYTYELDLRVKAMSKLRGASYTGK